MQSAQFFVILVLYLSTAIADDNKGFLYVIRWTYSTESAGSLVPRQNVCPSGTFECSDGGCCDIGSACAIFQGLQVCDRPCYPPPVPCGQLCCDAGFICII